MASTLRAMGHGVTIVTDRVTQQGADESVYAVDQARAARGVVRRAIDGLAYRLAPHTAFRHTTKRWLLVTVRRAITERGIQIFEMEESLGFARSIRRAMPAPVCVRLHGPWFLNGPALGIPQNAEFHRRVRDEGRAIREADAITSPSRDVLHQVCDFYGLNLPEAEVIPNPTWPVPAEQRWRLEDCDAKQVLFIGRFDRHKGGDLIIEAFARVLMAIPDARLRFVGPDRGCLADDGQHWHLENFIRKRIPGALETGRVECLGQQPFQALAQLRRDALLTVICSRYENFPYTAVEALAMGCPIVAANAGGIPEIVQNDRSGLLHRAEDAADIAAKIVDLLTHPARAAELARQAAMAAERQFYPDVVAGRVLEFYTKVIGRRAKSPRLHGAQTDFMGHSEPESNAPPISKPSH
jgi:glycosyltransferase involved in cell wall biosynthesis